jgi:hypothetical protein
VTPSHHPFVLPIIPESAELLLLFGQTLADLKLKCLIHSRHDGSIMVIPRENNLVRFYVQLLNEDSESGKIQNALHS